LYKKQELSEHQENYIQRLAQKDRITHWLSTRELHFDLGYTNDKINFKKQKLTKFVKLSYSDKRTLTGRINCSDKRFNPQMLEKKSEEKKHIVSRFGVDGEIVVFDYVSFETKISLYLTRDEDFINQYKDKDIHEETAKVIYQKDVLTEHERSLGKKINHTLLYGGGDELLNNILTDISDKENALIRIKEFLSPIINLSNTIKESSLNVGYMLNSFGTIIYPEKRFAAFSNYIQAMAADMVVDKLFEIKRLLADKKSQFLFQVHDSFVFDIHKNELNIIEEIKQLLSMFKNLEFQIEISKGNNFLECN
jgi:DNA polymerase I-like protein with 3'-5' exonuclease and polymerase domains